MSKPHFIVSRVLGLLLAAVPPVPSLAAPASEGPSPAAAAPAPSSVPGVVLWIEPTVPQGQMIHEWIEERARSVLSARARPLGSEDLIRVAVRGGSYDYRVHFALVRHHRLIKPQPDVLVCTCGTDEMLDRVGEAIEAGAERLEQVAEAERLASLAASAAEQAEQSRQAREPSLDRSRRWRPSTLGIVGLVVTGVGVTAFGSGITMTVAKPTLVRDRSSLVRDWQPSGIAALAIGASTLAAGVAMTVVDWVQCRKETAPARCERRRNAVGSRSIELAPSIDVTGSSVMTITGSF